MDAHELLGLAPDADAHAVKKAFRRLAMRWHPDRNPDPKALEHFKTLRAAYETLLAELTGNTPHATDGETADDVEEDDTPRGADRHADLTLTVEVACLGGKRVIELENEAMCTDCGGSGEEALRHTRLCPPCHGTGRTRGKHGLVACKRCAGRGYLTKQACPACAGSGRRRVLHPCPVTLPAGLLDGDEWRVAGAGDACAEVSGVPGDLVLHIRLAPHGLYRLDGRNLLLARPVSALTLLTGGELAIPLPGDVRMLRLEPGSAAARTLRVAGAGIPGRRGEPAGDLIVQLAPALPEAPDTAMHELLRQLDALVAGRLSRHLPDVALWEARWLQHTPDTRQARPHQTPRHS